MKIKAEKALIGMPWAILPGQLEVIHSIANRYNEEPEAVEKRIGRPLSNMRLGTQRGNVAIIPISGPIFRYANLLTLISGATSIQQLSLEFQNALDNPDIETILFDVDSPGGAVSGVQEFAQHVFEARGQKQIIAYASGMMASAAYWISSAADMIVASPTSIIGSIGVITTLEKGDEEGTVSIVSSQSPNKRPDLNTEAGRAKVQTLLDDLATVFIGTVARNRNITTDDVINKFDGGNVFVGEKATKVGLADSIGSLEGSLARLNAGKQPLKTKKYISADNEGVEPVADKNETPQITREYIAANHADIAESFRAEGAAKGKEEGMKAGAEAERTRISGIESAFKGYEAHAGLKEALINDGKSTKADAAVAILDADREARGKQAQALHDDGNEAVQAAPLVNVHAQEKDANAEATGPITLEEAEKIFASDEKVRGQFDDAKTYYHYRKHS